jgi:hypothetical protein
VGERDLIDLKIVGCVLQSSLQSDRSQSTTWWYVSWSNGLEDGIQCSNIVCHDRTEMEYISGVYMTLALQNHREMGLSFAKVKCCLEDVDVSPVDKERV